MISNKELANFLVKAKNNSYAAGENAKKTKLGDKGTEIIFQEGNLLYRDRYYGGEPFSGAEIVFFKGKPMWSMNFYGCVIKESLELSGSIYSFLRQALARVQANLPFRGPEEFKENEFAYLNKIEGSLNHFVGRESILINNKEVYHANYHGGFIDLISDEIADNVGNA